MLVELRARGFEELVVDLVGLLADEERRRVFELRHAELAQRRVQTYWSVVSSIIRTRALRSGSLGSIAGSG